MWIHSPLAKWDQDVLVEKALGGAQRRSMLGAGRGARERHWIDGLSHPATASLGPHANPVRKGADAVGSTPGTLRMKQRGLRQA